MKRWLLLLLISSSVFAAKSPVFEHKFIKPGESFLRLFFINTPYGVDWSSPKSIVKSNIKSHFSFNRNKLGHAAVQFRCGSEEDQFAGMSYTNLDAKSQLIVNGMGFGILWHSFQGRLETKEELLAEDYLPDHYKTGRVNFLTYKINLNTCKRLQAYLKEYKEKKMWRHYGLANRPRYGEGGGCSAYAASFFEVAGLMTQSMKDQWSKTIIIPEKLIGPPMTNNYVGIWTLLFGDHSWGDERYPHKKLFFYEPDMMYQSVVKMYQNPPSVYQKVKVENAIGLFADMSNVPTPKGPIFLQHTDPVYNPKLKQVEKDKK